jgi:hypothetical protein
VYTYRSGRFGALGPAALRVEATLTPANCARDVEAVVIRAGDGLRPASERLRLSMPTCSAEGELLVLDLLAPALTVARN